MNKPETRIYLTDDGTMDTVLRCGDCGEEFRYNYDPTDDALDFNESPEPGYDAFIAWAIEDTESDHECEQEG